MYRNVKTTAKLCSVFALRKNQLARISDSIGSEYSRSAMNAGDFSFGARDFRNFRQRNFQRLTHALTPSFADHPVGPIRVRMGCEECRRLNLDLASARSCSHCAGHHRPRQNRRRSRNTTLRDVRFEANRTEALRAVRRAPLTAQTLITLPQP